jgi:UDP-GlcNAc:undecaprenyl-phosphate GlcNAc-1-phosphate transferase
MNAYQLGFCALLGFGVSWATLDLVLRLYRRKKFHLSNRTEAHHTHTVSVPRLGGIGLVAAFIFTLLFAAKFSSNTLPWEIVVYSLLMFGVGIWDDFRPLGAKKKLVGQLMIATGAYLSGLAIHKFQVPFSLQVIDLGEWSWLVTILWVVGLTNLINLIDGVDGLAGGICLMLMFLMIFVGNQCCAGLMAAGMFGALLGFLKYNFPPARIYLGDGGAYFLGFLIACLTINSSQKGSVFAALTAPLFVLALPIVDTSLAILRRGLNGLPLFRPDRRHIHHRMLGMGMSRRKLVLCVYGFTAFFLALGFAAFWLRGEHIALLLGISLLAVLCVAGTLRFSRQWFAVKRVVGYSLEVRAEIQYALAQSRWLAMEGSRTPNLLKLSEDVVFIARKLGFTSVQIQLEDDVRSWQLQPVENAAQHFFQHKLPGHRYCFIKLGINSPKTAPAATNFAEIPKEFCMMSELVAEGWSKAVKTWQIQKGMPLRFHVLEASQDPPIAVFSAAKAAATPLR